MSFANNKTLKIALFDEKGSTCLKCTYVRLDVAIIIFIISRVVC